MAEKTGSEYTLENAEDHIGQLRGDTDRLTELHPLTDSQVPNTPGVGSGSQLYSVGGAPQAMTDTGMAGAVPVTSSDTGSTTVTASSATLLSAALTIPANDASANTAYRLNCWGNGTWGSTPQGVQFNAKFAGATFGTFPFIGSGNLSASQPFRWNASILILCLSTGAGGGWNGTVTVTITEVNNTVNIGTSGDESFSVVGGPSSNVTQDTTVSNDLALYVNWNSTTGSPTITCHGTVFERIAA